MFDKFGEFDSAAEINRAAAAQKEEGDREALLLLAAENGIDKEDAEDYLEDYIEELANPLTAALGKLQMEEKELKLGGVMTDWVDELRRMCTENEQLCIAVRRKGKDLAGYIALTADTGYQSRTVVDKRIVEKTMKVKKVVGSHEFAIGIPDKRKRRELAMQYYLGEEKK